MTLKQPLIDAYDFLKAFDPNVPVYHFKSEKELESGKKGSYIIYSEEFKPIRGDDRVAVTRFEINVTFVTNEIADLKYIDFYEHMLTAQKTLFSIEQKYDEKKKLLTLRLAYND